METKIDWLEKHSESSMTLFSIVRDLESLAKSFGATGNKDIHNYLLLLAGDIEKANKDMNDAIGESLNESIKRSGDSSKAILEAALAGITIATESNDTTS
jgi:hypothetical protein